MDSFGSQQGEVETFMNTVMNFRVPEFMEKFLLILKAIPSAHEISFTDLIG